jgi:DNA-directed RNA polymerase sigma subunit (sigma70/sigma32)
LLADIHQVRLAAVNEDEAIPKAVEYSIETMLSDYQSAWVRSQKAVQRGLYVLRLRYGLLEGQDPMTYREVGIEIGVSAGRVRQMLLKMLRIMRHPKYLDSLYRFITPGSHLLQD